MKSLKYCHSDREEVKEVIVKFLHTCQNSMIHASYHTIHYYSHEKQYGSYVQIRNEKVHNNSMPHIICL